MVSRYAGPGCPGSPVGFSGDSIMTWNSLKFQPEFTAIASNVGYGWCSHDIGGHMGGSRDDKMATRWLQYGVFSPHLEAPFFAQPMVIQGAVELWRRLGIATS
ncbi:hypothetical protein E4U60_005262 [Claviceps pazoutovae]|uniref:alpha-glucosidase n=1 Tax=Claviceps pazoutovae TaxID=1649127 RepID=A0A9P7SFA3_9HYPO|nr:hypothetical protein E4U60_005262 [Claviceps pazoutovae]